MDVSVLDPDQLETRLRSLLTGERRALAAFLVHLGEFDRRKQYRRHGYATLWQYCTEALGLSDTQAFFRMAAARLVQRFPVVARSRGRTDLHHVARVASQGVDGGERRAGAPDGGRKE